MERKLSDMMCRSFIKGNEVPDTSSVGSIDAETVALARSINGDTNGLKYNAFTYGE